MVPVNWFADKSLANPDEEKSTKANQTNKQQKFYPTNSQKKR